jgi:hypothetical protein
MRAVHLLLVSNQNVAQSLQASSGITKVIATSEPIEEHLW